MAWTVIVTPSAVEDLRWFGRKKSRLLLREATRRLQQDPTMETRHMKTLRPNLVAERELCIEEYRLLFNVDLKEGTSDDSGGGRESS